MATTKSAQVSSAKVRGNYRGADFTEFGEIAVSSAPAVGDIFELVQIPNGYAIESVILDCSAMDSNATPTLELEVGDAATPGRFISASGIAKAGGVQYANVAGATGYSYAIGTNNGQFSGGNAGATVLQAQVTAAAATFAAGTIRLAVRLFLPNGAFA